MKRVTITFFLCAVFTLAASGCSLIRDIGRLGQLTVRDAWSRPANAGSNGAVYFVIDNATNHDEELLSASAEVTGAAEFHQITLQFKVAGKVTLEASVRD